MRSRDDFPSSTIVALRDRVQGFCSNPACRCGTTGPNAEPGRATRIGVAAHITAAAPGGPRYDPALSQQIRSSAENGIWLCANCARRIDVDAQAFEVSLLLEWKAMAESFADETIGQRPLHQAMPEAEPGLDFICPHCGTTFNREHTICTGCHGQIVVGATAEERETAMYVGAAWGAMPLLWLYIKFEVQLMSLQGGLFSMLPLFSVLLLAFGGARFSTGIAENYRRRQPPRVFVRKFV